MSTQAAVEAPENTVTFRDPVVQSFYALVIDALAKHDDGASAASHITGEFHKRHTAYVRSNNALHDDIRRLTADDGAKAAMLSHASSFAGRMIADHARLVGQLHGHQTVESQLHELARQFDQTMPDAAEQIRDVLTGITPIPVPQGRSVIVAYTPDHRWHTGWFRRSDRPQDAPLEPLPYVGWALVAHDPDSPAQGVETAFLHGDSWYTAAELRERGMSLQRID